MVKTQARVTYERRTKTLIGSFKARQISFQECLRELDFAFERFLVPNREELSAIRALVLQNNNVVMQEMANRPIHLVQNNRPIHLMRNKKSKASAA
jgi:hypothetical protein